MRFEDRYIPEPNSGCWLWLGAQHYKGYGYLGNKGAHRISYELHKGPIPDGLQIDHLCRNRICVNPDHLEAVSSRTNILRGVSPSAICYRKTHCLNGHLLPRPSKSGHRSCRLCARQRWNDWFQNNREKWNAYQRDRKRKRDL